MIANSLVGLAQLVGEVATTLRHVSGETYSTATGKPTKTTQDYPVTARIRGITSRDRKSLGNELVEAASEIAVILANQMPPGIEPLAPDQLVASGRVWEIVAVQPRRMHGIVVEYVCQVSGH